MKIGILPVGQPVNASVIGRIQESLKMIFPKTTCIILDKTLPIPEEAFNKARQQYNSTIILNRIHGCAEEQKALDRILGITNVDLFVPNLNFVFGEAECPGKAALISLKRLKPEFYGKTANIDLLVERGTKEAVHEIGHTLGLTHCPNPFCVMHFSNSIFDTDTKQSLFCNRCYLKIEKAVNNLR